MNNIEKARDLIETIISTKSHTVAYVYASWHDKENNSEEKVKEVMNIALEALEKQIPKKTNDEKDFGECCPICRAPYGGGLYCRTCGQRLDVSN